MTHESTGLWAGLLKQGEYHSSQTSLLCIILFDPLKVSSDALEAVAMALLMEHSGVKI